MCHISPDYHSPQASFFILENLFRAQPGAVHLPRADMLPKIIKQKLIPPIRPPAILLTKFSQAIDDNKMTRRWDINLHFNITSPLTINSQLNFVGKFYWIRQLLSCRR